MPDIRKVAVVGLGIGRSHIVEGYLPHPDRFEVAAICDLDEDRLAMVGAEFGIERRTTRFEEVLAMPDIDIVDICTPPGIHGKLILQALDAGKHVVCEKPLVGSLAEADAVIEAERKARGRLMPIFQYRYGDGIQKAKRIIDAGIAGKPYVATCETHWIRTPEYYAVPWRGKWATELGGVLMTQSIHLHDMLTYLFGPVAGPVRPRFDAGQRHRGRGLRQREPHHGERRARHDQRHARLGRADQPLAAGLRERADRKQSRALQSRPGSLEDRSRLRQGGRRDRCGACRTGRRSRSASRRR